MSTNPINPTDLISFLPDELSDESAYHLVDFFFKLTAALESHYFGQMQRYVRDNTPPNLSVYTQKKSTKKCNNKIDF